MDEQWALPWEAELPAVPGTVKTARDSVTAAASTLGYRHDQLDRVRLAVSEACSNAILHAYPNGRIGSIRVQADELADGRLVVSIADDGRGMSAPDETRGLGLGLPLLAMLSDRLEIASPLSGGGTVVTLVFDTPTARRSCARRCAG